MCQFVGDCKTPSYSRLASGTENPKGPVLTPHFTHHWDVVVVHNLRDIQSGTNCPQVGRRAANPLQELAYDGPNRLVDPLDPR